MKRLVLDTCVIAAGFRSRSGASFHVLRAIAERRLVPLATPALFYEYEDVLKRHDQRLAHGFDLIAIDAALGALAALIEPVDVHFRWRPQLRDPKDEMVLEAAVNGRADALVTHNLRDFLPAADRFGLTVVAPQEIVWGLKQ